jgi:hypothetical protein
MNIKWDSNECEERFNNLNDNEKKLLLELKDKGGKLMLLVSEVDKLIKENDKSNNKDVNYIMCNELSLECIEDFITRVNN